MVVAEVCFSIGSSLALLKVGFLNTSGGEVLELLSEPKEPMINVIRFSHLSSK